MTEKTDIAAPDALPPAPGPRKSPLRRFLPLLILLALVLLAWATGLTESLRFEALQTHRDTLLAAVEANPVLAALAYVGTYALAIAVSLPGATLLTMTGGFLFGLVSGTGLAVLGATLGATLVFLIARTAFGDLLRERAGPAIRRMEEGFRADALSYLLFLRLVPLFPFWLVNLVPAFLGVRLTTYVLATAVGIVPASFVYASVGHGLDAAFASGEKPDFGLIFRPEILLPIAGLAVLALLPVAYGRWRRGRAARRRGAPG